MSLLGIDRLHSQGAEQKQTGQDMTGFFRQPCCQRSQIFALPEPVTAPPLKPLLGPPKGSGRKGAVEADLPSRKTTDAHLRCCHSGEGIRHREPGPGARETVGAGSGGKGSTCARAPPTCFTPWPRRVVGNCFRNRGSWVAQS